MNSRLNNRVLVAVIMAIAMILSVIAVGYSVRHRNDGPKTISVKGNASKDFISDLVVWELIINHHSQTPLEGFNSIGRQREVVRSFLLDNDISHDEIEVGNVSYELLEESYYDNNQQRFVRINNGYKVKQTITITSRNVDNVEQLAREVGDLIEQNVTVRSVAPRYYYTKLADLKLEMLGEASEDAYARAKQIAEKSGAKVGSLKQSSMGVFQILGKYSEEDYSWGGTLNTSSKEKTMTITVSSQYLID